MQRGFNGFPVGGADKPPSSLIDQTIYTPVADTTTTSLTFVDISLTNLPALTLILQVGDIVDLTLSAAWGHSAAGNVGAFDWNITRPSSAATNCRNGKYGAWAIELGTNSLDVNSQTAKGTYVATEAGIHTFTAQWRTSAGTFRIQGGGTYQTPVVHRAQVASRSVWGADPRV